MGKGKGKGKEKNKDDNTIAGEPEPSDANVFEESATNPTSLKEQLLGPDYPYYKYVRSPDQIGMSGKGSLDQLGKNIGGLTSYVQLLVEGTGKASATGKPLGNRFFLKTGGKCRPVDETVGATTTTESEDKDRYIYIDNVPAGNIPFISAGMGTNFKTMRGLIPGTLSDLNAFNPMRILGGFMEGSKPDCQLLTMETIDVYNNKSIESHYVTLADISAMDPCSFIDKKNPQTGQKCKEAFTSGINQNTLLNETTSINNMDIYDTIYWSMAGALGIYVLYNVCKKMRR